MSSNIGKTTFSPKESGFLPVSRRAGSNFHAHLIHFSIEDRVTSLNDFCTAPTKILVK